MRMRKQKNSSYQTRFIKPARILERAGEITSYELDAPKVLIQSYSAVKAYDIITRNYQEDNRLFLEDNCILPNLDL